MAETSDGKARVEVTVAMAPAMAEAIDAYAARAGVPAQDVIKVWLQERIDVEAERRARVAAAS